MVIDGGKGQLSAALAALRDQGYGDRSAPFTVIALAKQRRPSAGPHPGRAGEGSSSEGSLGSNPGGNAQGSGEPDRVFLPRVKDPLRLRPNTAELFLLSRIRDEAHRFAIAYHRKLRRRRALGGALREVAGVGAQRARLLLRHFGSLKRIRAASVEELAAVPGMTRRVAEAVRRFFGGAAATNSKTQA
jgi:excinuclease ABC subunit C